MATMLHWIAGAKNTGNINESSACIDPPETPAPVFAYRSFKHAIFGTPQTTQRPQPRRHSTAENHPRPPESPKPTRPRMNRPASASDANALMPPPASPTKGILMTPGTAAAKKKNVTFGDHVVDNEEKKPLKTGLPDDCPGKFPSPWNKQGDGENGGTENRRGRSKLTEALEQARDESRQRKAESDERSIDAHRSDSPAPENDCCEYWRREYEVYRTNTQREVKKLVKKYKAAKDYAQSRDDEASDLRLHLQEAETKADALEEAVNLLTSQIKEMDERFKAQPQPQPETETLVPPIQNAKQRDRPRDLQALLERRGSKERTVSSTTVRTTENDQLQRPSEPRPRSSRRAPDVDQAQRPSEATSAPESRKEDPDQEYQPQETASTAKDAHQAPAAGRTPATIAARWAAVKDAPQRPSEPAQASTRRETKTSRETLRAKKHPEPAKPAAEQAERANGPVQDLADPAIASKKLSPPPGELLAASEPAVYSPPSKPPISTTTTSAKPAAPPAPTVEDDIASVANDPAPPAPPARASEEAVPPVPPAHASGTVTISARPRPSRQDSGAGGTLKPMSANARSGTGSGSGNAGTGTGAGAGGQGDGARVGRDGKEIDPARLEAAKARLRGRGRDVS